MLKTLHYWTIGLLGRTFRALYNWLMHEASTPHASVTMCIVSFFEACLVPIPPDIMLWPMAMKRPDKAYWYAFICTIASVCGGIMGYVIGYYLEGYAREFLTFTGHAHDLEVFQSVVKEYGARLILAKGITPIPFQFVTIASGLAHMNLWQFIAAATAIRSFRFFVTAFVLNRWGPAMLKMIEKRMITVGLIAIALLVVLFVVLRVMH